MCSFGCKKEKQYHIHWKGYSNAHDTWEPEQNIHAPELLSEYHHNQVDSIRAMRAGPERGMFRESHLSIPEQSSTVHSVSSPESATTIPKFA